MTNNELVPVIQIDRAAAEAFFPVFSRPSAHEALAEAFARHRTRTASGEGLRKALERISSLTPHNANAHSAEDFSATVRAIADTALADHSAAPPSELREALEMCRMQFAFYADEHMKAGKIVKMETNLRFAELCSRALSSTKAEITEEDEDIGRILAIIDKIDAQAKCLEGYAEQSGFKPEPIPSVFHFQASHFRDLATELRAALKHSEGA